MIHCPACGMVASGDEFLQIGDHKLICPICLSILEDGFICPECGRFNINCTDPFIDNHHLMAMARPILKILRIRKKRYGICGICKKISACGDFKKELRQANVENKGIEKHKITDNYS